MDPVQRHKDDVKAHLLSTLTHLGYADSEGRVNQGALTRDALATAGKYVGDFELDGTGKANSHLVLAALGAMSAIDMVNAGQMQEATGLVENLVGFVCGPRYAFSKQVKAGFLLAKDQLLPGSVGPSTGPPITIAAP